MVTVIVASLLVFSVEECSSTIVLDFSRKVVVPLLKNRQWDGRFRSTPVSCSGLISGSSCFGHVRELNIPSKGM